MPDSTPKTLKYDLVNVFIADGKPYTGNPLAVIYDAAHLSQAQCLVLAKQFNLSEITFPQDVESSSYRVRIFTPPSEIPFAGHPTLGTCFALLHRGLDASKGNAVQHSLSGATDLTFSQQASHPFKSARISMRARPFFLSERQPLYPEKLAEATGLKANELDQRVKFVRGGSCGLPWPVIAFDSLETLDKLSVGTSGLLGWIAAARQGVSDGAEAGKFIDGFAAIVVDKQAEVTQVRARIFFDANGSVVEDPATGSAALALGLVLHAENLLPPNRRYAVSQGAEVGKPSQLFGEVEVGSDGQVAGVHVSGDVVKVGSGEFVEAGL